MSNGSVVFIPVNAVVIVFQSEKTSSEMTIPATFCFHKSTTAGALFFFLVRSRTTCGAEPPTPRQHSCRVSNILVSGIAL